MGRGDLSDDQFELLLRTLASRERRQAGALIDVLVVFGVPLTLGSVVALPNWGFFIALGAIWFLLQVPPIAIRGRTVGHWICGTRVAVWTRSPDGSELWTRPPGWRRALVRWLGLVPGVLANRVGKSCPHDRWSGTLVLSGPPHDGLDLRRPERWLQRAQELDRLARDRPRQYRLRVALVAAAGYAFIVGLALLQLVAAVVVAVLVVHGTLHGLGALTWPFVLVAYGCYALSSLWMSRRLPEGSPITSATAPMLVDTVNELRIRLDAPPVDILVLDSRANAGMLQQPRFGPFGPYRNVLVIGLPLLQALPLDELRAVIAHELAHLARRHGHLGAWVYRLRKAYPELLERLENKGWTAAVVRAFFERYVPYFDLCTLAMTRAHEFEADRLAAEICRPTVVAAALRRSELLDRFLSERAAEADGLPVPEQALDADADDRWEDLLDSHPSVARRLQALDAASEPLPVLTASAATALLPGELALGLRPTDGLDSPALQRFAAFTAPSTRAASGEGARR